MLCVPNTIVTNGSKTLKVPPVSQFLQYCVMSYASSNEHLQYHL